MNDLINVKNENGKLLVSARDLHEFLEIKTKFTDWFPRICEYGFEEDIDYVLCSKMSAANQYGGTKEIQDYACNISMAKEIAMIQRSDKGKQARKYFIQCEEQLKTIAIQSPKAFVDSLALTEYSIEKYLPNFLTWKNVDEVLPLLIERVGNSVDKGDIKLGVLNSVIKVTKEVRNACELSAQKEIMTMYIEQAQEKYDRILIASKAGLTSASNNLRKQLEDKDKELKKAETKRLKTFSRKSLLRAYEEDNIIHDMVEDYIKDVVDDELYKIFVDNLEAIVSEIVKKSGKSYSDVHMDIYKSMGIRNKGSFKTYTEYIFYNQLEFRCLDKASDILNRY